MSEKIEPIIVIQDGQEIVIHPEETERAVWVDDPKEWEREEA